jgi:hypothetical protein
MKRQKVIYFHGWKSSPDSDKVKYLSEFFDVVSPAIPEDYNTAIRELDIVVSQNPDAILVGTSLGGYWANTMAQLWGLASCIINPSCQPNKTLGIDYPDLVVGSTSAHRSVLLSTDDTVLNHTIAETLFSEKAVIKKFDNCGHRFNKYDVIKSEICLLSNHQCDHI